MTLEDGGLFDRPTLLPGNLAKLKILDELQALVESQETPISILDVGCVGPTPYNLWEGFLSVYGDRIRLTGIDVRGIEEARQMARRKGLDLELLEMSSYEMSSKLEPRFDVVVSTQVLEHLAQPARFFQELAGVMNSKTVAYLTLDSRHYAQRSRLEEWAHYVVGRFIAERYYDVGLREEELAAMAGEAGLRILERRFYNIHPLKRIHNHETSDRNKNAYLSRWFELEENLNEDEPFICKHAEYFAGIYLKLVRNNF